MPKQGPLDDLVVLLPGSVDSVLEAGDDTGAEQAVASGA
jgi:hypothetical protein